MGDNPFIELHINPQNSGENQNLHQRISTQNLASQTSQSFSISPRNRFNTTSNQINQCDKHDKSIQAFIEKEIENSCNQTEILSSAMGQTQTDICMKTNCSSLDIIKMQDEECSVKLYEKNTVDSQIPNLSLTSVSSHSFIIKSQFIKNNSNKFGRKTFLHSVDKKNKNKNLTEDPESVQSPMIFPSNFRIITTKSKPLVGNLIINNWMNKTK